jgi:hypothetical protein
MHSVLRALRAGIVFFAALGGVTAFSRELTPDAREFPPRPPDVQDPRQEKPRETPRHTPSQLELFSDPPEPEPT